MKLLKQLAVFKSLNNAYPSQSVCFSTHLQCFFVHKHHTIMQHKQSRVKASFVRWWVEGKRWEEEEEEGGKT